MTDLAFIAVGGAAGALGRYAVLTASASVASGFPYGTVLVNVLGALLMGMLVEGIALGVDVPESLRLALAIGLLGSFTTFSAFSFDAYSLYVDGRLAAAGLYVAASTILSIGALFAGVGIARAAGSLVA